MRYKSNGSYLFCNNKYLSLKARINFKSYLYFIILFHFIHYVSIMTVRSRLSLYNESPVKMTLPYRTVTVLYRDRDPKTVIIIPYTVTVTF